MLKLIFAVFVVWLLAKQFLFILGLVVAIACLFMPRFRLVLLLASIVLLVCMVKANLDVLGFYGL